MARQELGTAKGLEPEPNMLEGCFTMSFGNLTVEIHPDPECGGCILLAVRMDSVSAQIVQFHNRETLARNYDQEDIYQRKRNRAALEEWVDAHEPEYLHKQIDQIYNRP